MIPGGLCSSFDKQIDGPGVGHDHVDQHRGFPVALDVTDGQRVGVSDIGRLGHGVERREQRTVLSARHAGDGEFGAGLDGNAEFLADRVVDIGAERHWLVGIFGDNPQRQHDLVVIAQRIAAGAVVKFRRSRPQHGDGLDIFRFGEIETRRHAGIARRPPIGFPSRLQLKGDTAQQHCPAARSRQQPDRGMSIPLPWRGILGAGLDGQG